MCTDTALVLPSYPRLWSRRTISVPYSDMTKLRRTVFGQVKGISIVHAGGRLGIGPDMLRRKEDFDELFDELVRRLRSFDAEVETREYLWYRPRFSLRFMLVVTAVVAAVLGLRRWLDPEFHLSDLVVLGIMSLLLLIELWLIFLARWSARIFAIGFVLGMLLEIQLVCISWGGTIPQGPYSSTMICEQLSMTPGSSLQSYSYGWLVLAGMTISGIVGGAAFLLVWHAVKRVVRRRRGTADSS